MSLQQVLSRVAHRPDVSFPVSLAIGTMLASLAVVAYAAFVSPESAARAQIILQGAEIIVLTLTSGVIAGAVHWLGTRGETAGPLALPGTRRTATA